MEDEGIKIKVEKQSKENPKRIQVKKIKEMHERKKFTIDYMTKLIFENYCST